MRVRHSPQPISPNEYAELATLRSCGDGLARCLLDNRRAAPIFGGPYEQTDAHPVDAGNARARAECSPALRPTKRCQLALIEHARGAVAEPLVSVSVAGSICAAWPEPEPFRPGTAQPAARRPARCRCPGSVERQQP